MFTRPDSYRSPVILSVHVNATPARLALVVTQSPAVARAVTDYLREKDGKLSVVWMPTVAAACRRLKTDHAVTVIVDSALSESGEALDILYQADPSTHLQLLAGGVEDGF